MIITRKETQRPEHTPGPWQTDSGEYGAFVRINNRFSEHGYNLSFGIHWGCWRRGTMPYPDWVWLRDQGKANARLCAAAPDFYSACATERDTVSRLDWLSSLLAEIVPAQYEDAEAMGTALAESRTLVDELRAALRRATGEVQG